MGEEMTEEKDYVFCIADTRVPFIGKSLCGRTIGRMNPKTQELNEYEFCFRDVSHWINTYFGGGRQIACKDCSEVIKLALKAQTDA